MRGRQMEAARVICGAGAAAAVSRCRCSARCARAPPVSAEKKRTPTHPPPPTHQVGFHLRFLYFRGRRRRRTDGDLSGDDDATESLKDGRR